MPSECLSKARLTLIRASLKRFSEKQRLIGRLISLIHDSIKEYGTVEAVDELFNSERGHFFEMKHLLEVISAMPTPPPFLKKERVVQLLAHMHSLLRRAICTCFRSLRRLR